MPDDVWRYTDDTEMALSVVAVLRRFAGIDQDALAQHFSKHFDASRGYGTGAMKLLNRLRSGDDWRAVSRELFEGEGSFGNGGAMRVAPVGAYFADDLAAAVTNARKSAEVTHAHPEGVAGAVAVAAAAAVASRLPDDDAKPSLPDFFEQVLPHIPEGEVRDNCLTASNIAAGSPGEAAEALGNGRNMAAMDTVPIALWCAAHYLDDYEEAMWQLAAIGGDVDTTCAIAGGVIACYAAETIPAAWIERREDLPKWAFEGEE